MPPITFHRLYSLWWPITFYSLERLCLPIPPFQGWTNFRAILNAMFEPGNEHKIVATHKRASNPERGMYVSDGQRPSYERYMLAKSNTHLANVMPKWSFFFHRLAYAGIYRPFRAWWANDKSMHKMLPRATNTKLKEPTNERQRPERAVYVSDGQRPS